MVHQKVHRKIPCSSSILVKMSSRQLETLRHKGDWGCRHMYMEESQLHTVRVDVMEMRSPIESFQGNSMRGQMMELWKENSVGRGD